MDGGTVRFRQFFIKALLTLAAIADAMTPAVAETRVLAIGIDRYPYITPALRGAKADAEDVAAAFAKRGVKDITKLVEQQATRKAVIEAIEALIARTGNDDLVAISFAGHGAREAWGRSRPPGAVEGDLHEVLLLWNMAAPNARGQVDKSRGDAGDRLSGTEMNLYLKRLSDKGARILYTVDACFGGGAVRSPHLSRFIRSPTVREVPVMRFAEGQDPLSSLYARLPAPVDTDTALPKLTFLAAVSSKTTSPEVPIPLGSTTLRGALSYSLARAIEGSVDKLASDGAIRRGDLIDFLNASIDVFAGNRQVPEFRPLKDFEQVVLDERKDFADAVPAPARPELVRTVKVWIEAGRPVAASDGAGGAFRIEPAENAEQADIVLDAASGEVTDWYELVASGIDAGSILAVAERQFAQRQLQALAFGRMRKMQLVPLAGNPAPGAGNRRYGRGERLDLDGRADSATSSERLYYTLINLAGDGTVQFLYPLPSDPVLLLQDRPFSDIVATAPFGSDLFVLVTSPTPMDVLIGRLKALDGKKQPLTAVDAIAAALGDGVKIGLQGFYTSIDGK